MTYCTGAHPEIRAHCRSGKRPTEFGNKVWPTSLVAIDYLAGHPELLSVSSRGGRVLEIGCGWGLIGVYLAAAHSCTVTCTDLDPHVLPIVALHARLNQVTVQTVQSSLSNLSADFLGQFDLIIGAEICYSDEMSSALMNLIQRGFRTSVSQIIIVDPGRPDFDDCQTFCESRFETHRHTLPGTANGKQTYMLELKQRSVDGI